MSRGLRLLREPELGPEYDSPLIESFLAKGLLVPGSRV